MTKICLCLNAKTIAEDLRLLNLYRKYVDIAELRVDCLAAEELESVRRFPEIAGLPVILTVRRKQDGGAFIRGEAARIILISKALAFAKADRRKNFAYVDLEDDLDIPSLEEVARAFGTRIIRSFHNMSGTDSDLAGRISSLSRVGDEIVKAAVMPRSIEDVCLIIQAARSLKGRDGVVLAMGDMGQCTRILAAKFNAYLTYVSAKASDGVPPAASGQLNPIELTETYRFRQIHEKTAVYGITGYPLTTTFSPEFHNAVFAQEHLDAVYLRFPSETVSGFMHLARELDIQGASVTIPHKEKMLSYVSEISSEAASIGACNTIIRRGSSWHGYNTDAPGFSGSLLNLLGRTHLKNMKVTIIGAGGVSRAVVSELARLGAKGIILNRHIYRAQQLAEIYNFKYAALEETGENLIRKFSDIFIQTTSVGMEPDISSDPLPQYRFTGKEVVMDLIYKPEVTAFLARAASVGCVTINGYDMLLRQAKQQFLCFLGQGYPESRLNK